MVIIKEIFHNFNLSSVTSAWVIPVNAVIQITGLIAQKSSTTIGACLLFCLLSRTVCRPSLLYYPNLPIMSLTKVNSLMVNDDDPM